MVCLVRYLKLEGPLVSTPALTSTSSDCQGKHTVTPVSELHTNVAGLRSLVLIHVTCVWFNRPTAEHVATTMLIIATAFTIIQGSVLYQTAVLVLDC